MSLKKNTRNLLDTITNPFQRFFEIEASGGILLIVFTAIALVWANSPWSHYYQEFWHYELSIGIGEYKLSHSILHWINDGFMAIFFFVVGLEIKREMMTGELSSFKKASLPISAAIGGMVVPATIFLLINKNQPGAEGWGVPMATDIAFSLGVLTLLGKRVPLSLKIFLVAFAIVDDLGAVIIIAFFYSQDIQWDMLLYSGLLLSLLVVFNYLNIRHIPLYMLVGWFIWFLFMKSGIHPTLAGVLIAFTIPANRRLDISTFKENMDRNLQPYCLKCNDKITLNHDQLESIDNMETLIRRVQSPLQSLEHSLHGFVTFVVMPLFALTNAGVILTQSGSGFFSPLSINIEISLIFGKVIGIALFSWLAVKIGMSALPRNVNWSHILGLGFLGGMGFTMSLFISNLAYTDNVNMLNEAKIGILVGSLVAGITGYLILRSTLKLQEIPPQD